MTVPRLLSPFMRTRTRLAFTLAVLLSALLAALLPWWLEIRDRGGRQTGTAAKAIAPRDEATAMAEAARLGKEVLVETATTATSLTWALPTGQLRTTIHATPQRAKTATGTWAPVDTALIRAHSASGGLTVRPVNPPDPVRFSGGGTENGETVLAETELDGHTIRYIWPGPLPRPVLDGPRALYPEVLPGVDLLVVARDTGGFGQLLIVKSRSTATIKAVSAVTYGLRSSTLVFRHDPTTGGVRVLDRKSGQEVGSIPTPYAWDSSGRDPDSPEAPRTAVGTPAEVLRLTGLSGAEPGARQTRIPTRLDGDGTGEVRLHLDAAATGLLTDSQARFPVFLDPTLISGTLAWATVYKKSPNSNTWNGTNYNSGTTEARVGYESETGHTTRSFWRMGSTTSLKGATVSSASFKVLNTHSWSCTAREMQLWLTGSISSGTTWNSQPTWRKELQRRSFAYGYSNKCADDYVSFNVKEAAQQGADSGWPNITFGMRATNESDTFTWRKFKAKSAELTIVYNRPPNEPTNGISTPGGACVPGPGGGVTIARTNIVLTATATDPDGNLKGLRFRFWKTGGTVPAGTLVTNLSNGRGSLTIPASSLEDKATYSWDVRAEDTSNAVSTYFPPGTEPCRLTIDATAPPAPEVTSEVFLEATPDGATWATVKFGETGSVTFSAEGATRFTYSLDGIGSVSVNASGGKATVPDLRPRHSGPTTLRVHAFDAVGNQSQPTDYTFYVPPRDLVDGPGDTGGDGIPDLLVIDAEGKLRTYAGDENGELHAWLHASYTGDRKLNPAGHWWDPDTGKAALITKYSDAYPGDGATDLFVRTPDGGFWLYPGDGYGSFNVDQRLRVLLPANAPNPATWTQIKAVGDINGDKQPDLVLRAGSEFWTLLGYTGASFQEAVLMEDGWARREIVNVADMDLDGTPDLLWRNLDNGTLYVRHGKPGTASGSADLDSLKRAGNSRAGDVQFGTGWTESAATVAIGIPDVNGDRVPDIWTWSSGDGKIRVVHPSTTNAGAPSRVVLDDAKHKDAKGFG